MRAANGSVLVLKDKVPDEVSCRSTSPLGGLAVFLDAIFVECREFEKQGIPFDVELDGYRVVPKTPGKDTMDTGGPDSSS